METKLCRWCNTEKPLNQFYMDNRRGERRHKCIACFKQYEVDNKERVNVNKKRWLLKNTEKRKEVSKRYYNKPSVKVRYKVIAHDAISKRYGFGVTSSFTESDWDEMILAQDNKCACCGVEFSDTVTPTIDCILPLSKGGTLEPCNTQALCLRCNDIKRDMEIRFMRINGEEWWFDIPRFKKILQVKA